MPFWGGNLTLAHSLFFIKDMPLDRDTDSFDCIFSYLTFYRVWKWFILFHHRIEDNFTVELNFSNLIHWSSKLGPRIRIFIYVPSHVVMNPQNCLVLGHFLRPCSFTIFFRQQQHQAIFSVNLLTEQVDGKSWRKNDHLDSATFPSG